MLRRGGDYVEALQLCGEGECGALSLHALSERGQGVAQGGSHQP